MKTKNNRHSLVAVLAVMLMVSSTVVVAQDDDLLADTDTILNSEQIDIDGSFSRRQSAADRMAKMRKRLEQQNEQMVQKKIEDIRVKNEQKLAGDLKDAFNGKGMQQDEVKTAQAAPQQVVVVQAPKEEPKKEEKKNKIIPNLGISQFNGEDVDGFESDANIGLAFENELSERFSVGLGIGYTKMTVNVNDNNFNNFINYNYQYGTFNAGNNFSTGETEVGYTRLNLDIYGKFFLTTESRIRPYLGAGLGYNRVSLKYDKQGSNFNNYNNQSFNGEEDNTTSGSNVSGSAMIGAEIVFTDTVGLNLAANYRRALTTSFTDKEAKTDAFGFSNTNETVLNNIGEKIENSDEVALNLGLIIKF